jgi:hypothetical protein
VLECHVTGDLIFAAPPDAILTSLAPPNAVPAARNAGSTWMGTRTTSLRELRLRRIPPLPPLTSALFPRRRRICSHPPTWTVHQRLKAPRFSPYFDNYIGAIDGTHVPVVVPAQHVVQHTGRHGYTSQNMLAVCDFDMRFTFVVAGWPGLVHDMRVFKDALDKYGDKYPHPPQGIGFLYELFFHTVAIVSMLLTIKSLNV